jgi:hypothetical protein
MEGSTSVGAGETATDPVDIADLTLGVRRQPGRQATLAVRGGDWLRLGSGAMRGADMHAQNVGGRLDGLLDRLGDEDAVQHIKTRALVLQRRATPDGRAAARSPNAARQPDAHPTAEPCLP